MNKYGIWLNCNDLFLLYWRLCIWALSIILLDVEFLNMKIILNIFYAHLKLYVHA